MNHLDFVDAVRRESAAMAEAARSVAPQTPVPMLGWTMAKLVGHVGTVHRWAAAMIETRATERLPREALPVPPEDATVVDWLTEGTKKLIAVLSSTDPATAVWSFASDHSAGFWARRMAHETAIHRWDAQHAIGKPQPIDASLAADGVDEILGVVAVRFADRFAGGSGQTIHLHCTDVPGEWLARLAPKGLEIERVHAKGDVAARGKASDLDLFLWSRLGADALEVFGDRALLEKFQKLVEH